MIKELIEKYSKFIAKHPYIVLAFALLITLFSIYMAGTITMKTSGHTDFLPKDLESIKTLFTIEDEFGSTNVLYFIVETDPNYPGSNEIRDVRDPEVLQYMNNLDGLALHTDSVIETTSPASVLKSMNEGRIPPSIREVQKLTYKNGLLDGYISKDYTMALVKIRTTDDVDLDSMELEFEKIISQVPKPAGIITSIGGAIMEQQVVKKAISPDMERTSKYSLFGILIIILVVFRSIKYGLIPLTTIIFGTIWTMGYVGLIGMGLSSATSGVLSMIMGIGIDFGIQVTTRYRHELPGKTPARSMEISLNNVIIPMLTTTLAALIGFQAMQLGKLSFLNEMGIMMGYGVAASMLAAITAVPALLIIFDKIDAKNMYIKFKNIFKERT
jgi:predicted RND superfamily exporter protein